MENGSRNPQLCNFQIPYSESSQTNVSVDNKREGEPEKPVTAHPNASR